MKSKRRSRPKAPKAGTLGRRIYDERHARYMSQRTLAAKCRVSHAAVSHWENNITVPRLELRPIIAGALGVYPHMLFEGVDEAESA